MASRASEKTDQPTPDAIVIEMAADRAQRRDERQAMVAMTSQDLATAPQRTSFLPANMGEAMQFAELMAKSNFVPNHLRMKPGDCMAVVLIASRWGLDPFAVASKTYFVKDGAPAAFEAQLVNAVINSSGALSGRLRYQYEGEGEKLRCTVSGYLRADPNDEKVKTQSIARISTRNSPLWKNDPEQQLGYYTSRAWCRLHCPEILLGVYTPDEMEVDPERARVVSPAIPLRNQRRLAAVDHDPVTGEIITEQNQPPDADSDPRENAGAPQTLPAGSGAAGESGAHLQRHDGQAGYDLAEDGPDPRQAAVDTIKAGIAHAQNVIDLKGLEKANSATITALPDDMREDVIDAFRARDADMRRPK